MALKEIDDENVFLIPRDSGFEDPEKLNNAVQRNKISRSKIIIGPINYTDFNEVKKYNDLVFISPSNIDPDFQNNIISIGISLESQMITLKNFIKKQKKNKTVILIPKNQYTDLIDEKLKKLDLTNYRTFKYNPDPKILTGEIEILTNYSQRKRNLKLRKKCLKIKKMNNQNVN